MTILRSGSTKKYSENWAKAFGGGKKKVAKKTPAKPAKKQAAAKKKTKTRK